MADGGERAPVLIVDDEPALRELFATALRRADIPVLVASTGDEALEIVARTRLSLIVMDVGMPGRNGLEVLAELKADRATATLPVILVTGSAGDEFVVRGLEAGADDFIAKPVRTDELVARVRAHLRGVESWESRLHDEILDRARLVETLSRIGPSGQPDETAEVIVRALVEETAPDFVAVLQLSGEETLRPLAAYAAATGVERGGRALPEGAARHLLSMSANGPWSEVVDPAVFDPRDDSAFALSRPHSTAGAPIHVGDRLVGILVIGATDVVGATARATLLAAAIDCAVVLSAVAGPALDDRRQLAQVRVRLGAVLESGAFTSVFQPIVRLVDGTTIGFEALTRFNDGVEPATRLEEAARAGLTTPYDLKLIIAALTQAEALPADMLLSLNVAPETILTGSLGRAVRHVARPLVFEITEHAPIPDYEELRFAIRSLGDDVSIAVDDAGAGYASLRHILELRPAFAKLDMTIVRGVDRDALRQAMVAGLVYFANSTGCRLIAEGVETRPEALTLERLGVELAQGYLYGRPAPAGSW
jgi:EAL domain-containing protein (putative c-di-GMP-specific phosphodiesterase class I)/DNA-binding NarL/FixJ family response regulator